MSTKLLCMAGSFWISYEESVTATPSSDKIPQDRCDQVPSSETISKERQNFHGDGLFVGQEEQMVP